MDNTVPPHASQDNLIPKTTFIYALIDPETNEIRYIGKSNNPKKRLEKHRNHNEGDTHKQRWINSLKKRELKPLMQIIEEVPFDSWREREHYWIAYYREQGCDLTNTSPGGLGPEYVAPETRAKLRASNLGKACPPETRIKLSKAHKGRVKSPEECKHISEAKQGVKRKPFTEEARRNMGNASRGRKYPPKSPETRRKISEAHLGRKRGPYSAERRANITAGIRRFHAMKKLPPESPTLWD